MKGPVREPPPPIDEASPLFPQPPSPNHPMNRVSAGTHGNFEGSMTPMNCLRSALQFLLLLLILGAPSATLAAPIFEDTFDAEPGSGDGGSGGSGLNYAAFANWSITLGTVDLIGHGDFGIDCPGLSGKCVDLDGSSNDAGVMTSTSILLAPGEYDFAYTLAGVSSAFSGPDAEADNIVDVTIGSLFIEQVTVLYDTPAQVHGGTFTVLTSTSVSIEFSNQGGDSFGAMLDSVILTQVPEPGSAPLVAAGLLVIALRARRRER